MVPAQAGDVGGQAEGREDGRHDGGLGELGDEAAAAATAVAPEDVDDEHPSQQLGPAVAAAGHAHPRPQLQDRLRHWPSGPIAGSEIRNWNDQACFDPGGAGKSLSATIAGCELTDAWPIVGFKGHAAIWIRGPGNSTVDVEDTLFASSHDGLETAAFAGDLLDITVTNSRFEDNENGIEVVGGGSITMDVESCWFERNFQKGLLNEGTALDKPTAAIISRPDSALDLTVRRSVFIDSATGVAWRKGSGSTLDLGQSGDPDENSFCIDFSLFSPGFDPYTVCVAQKDDIPVPVPVTLFAVGNYWVSV